MITSPRYGCVRFRLWRRTKSVSSRWNAAASFVTPKWSMVNSELQNWFFGKRVFLAAWSSKISIFGKSNASFDVRRLTVCESVACDRPERQKVEPTRETWKHEVCPQWACCQIRITWKRLLQLVTARFCDEWSCTVNWTVEYMRSCDFHYREHYFIDATHITVSGWSSPYSSLTEWCCRRIRSPRLTSATRCFGTVRMQLDRSDCLPQFQLERYLT